MSIVKPGLIKYAAQFARLQLPINELPRFFTFLRYNETFLKINY
jgi:hypothetical protein